MYFLMHLFYNAYPWLDNAEKIPLLGSWLEWHQPPVSSQTTSQGGWEIYWEVGQDTKRGYKAYNNLSDQSSSMTLWTDSSRNTQIPLKNPITPQASQCPFREDWFDIKFGGSNLAVFNCFPSHLKLKGKKKLKAYLIFTWKMITSQAVMPTRYIWCCHRRDYQSLL